MEMRSVIRGVGGYLPEKILTNADLTSMVDTNDIWIRERTGIEKRHIAAEGEHTSHMAAHACRAALTDAGMDVSEIDGVVVATSTPDATMPSVATMLQSTLGLPVGAALDVEAACTGFVYALSVAHGWILSGLAKNILVVGAESMSRIVDWEDRGTCILFGDGAGAVVLSAVPAAEAGVRGIRSMALFAEGRHGLLLGTNGGVSGTQNAGVLFMQGQEVFKHGVEKMTQAAQVALERANLTLADVQWVVPHQANARMIQAIAKRLGIAETRMVSAVSQHANTSAASIPLALSAVKTTLKQGDIVVMPALGAGLTWGCCVMSW